MGHIIRKLPIRGSKGQKMLNVLFDSGASHSMINDKTANSLCHVIPLDEPMELTLVNGDTITANGSCTFTTTLKTKAPKIKCSLTGTALVSSELKQMDKEDMIIGVPELQTYQIGLRFYPKGKDKLDLTKCVRRVDRV